MAFIVKEQSKKHPSGVAVSGPLETMDGALQMKELLEKEAAKTADDQNPRYFFVTAHIVRGKK